MNQAPEGFFELIDLIATTHQKRGRGRPPTSQKDKVSTPKVKVPKIPKEKKEKKCPGKRGRPKKIPLEGESLPKRQNRGAGSRTY